MGESGRGASRDSIVDVWGARTPYAGENEWPERVDEKTVETPERWVQSCCVLCSNGCALDIGVKGDRIVGVRGRGVDRVNRGRLGPKGLHGWMANHSEDRLRRPLVRRGGKLVEASWDEAMSLIVERTEDLLDRFGPGSIGFYNSGQLFLEEYYTLAIVARAGIGTNHVDGNTRLCTSTSAQALVLSFGSDGGPGSYSDYDLCDTAFLFGHNMAETQTVLWSRLLDRRAGPNPLRLIVVDPRRTPTAREADLHLTPRFGTNLALMNGLLHLIIRNGAIDRDFIDRHTVNFQILEEVVAKYPPSRTSSITGVPEPELLRAAAMLGESKRLVSSCLQGVYQAHQATATAVQMNNLHLLRGMIGKPGCTIFQMNGQPTAQNTRETGANGELAAFLNWNNEKHVEVLARHWNVEPSRIPHHSEPTHIMQILRYAEQGSLRMLWIAGTNPAVSLPDLDRIRRILSQDELFTVVTDAFMTETAELADVVLPAAIWAEKTGTFTNADRTVHISHQAVAPPGEARSDFDIFVDFAERMRFTDAGGAPLVKWSQPEEAFEHFKELTRGRPCDYSGLSYAKLTGGSGIQWPCNDRHPEGKARLYTDHRFNTDADECESYGHDLVTGAAVNEEQYRARAPAGRAILRAAEWTAPVEQPSKNYPFVLTTGRRVHHFHTRTKTGRSPALARAAPDVWLEIGEVDARRLEVREGDWVEIESRRGTVQAKVKIGELSEGLVFLPFHYGYWDASDRSRAANELTMSSWDPVSKQPTFKHAAVKIRRIKEPTHARR